MHVQLYSTFSTSHRPLVYISDMHLTSAISSRDVCQHHAQSVHCWHVLRMYRLHSVTSFSDSAAGTGLHQETCSCEGLVRSHVPGKPGRVHILEVCKLRTHAASHRVLCAVCSDLLACG